MANAFVTKLIDDNGNPREAVVLRGYLAAPEFKLILDKLEATGFSKVSSTNRKTILDAARKLFGTNVNRIYLSAKFDRWVDFADADVIQYVPSAGVGTDPQEDFSTTVWLRVPRLRENAEQYKLVTRTTLAPDDGFVRGRLVDDFMDDPAAQVVWDEQGYVTGARRPSTIFCTA